MDRLILGQDIFGRKAQFRRVAIDSTYPVFFAGASGRLSASGDASDHTMGLVHPQNGYYSRQVLP